MDKKICQVLAAGFVAVVFGFVAFSTRMRAQEYFGTIIGTVSDASGAAVPGANITVTNNNTGAILHARTNQYGYYTVGQLIPNEYSVKAEMKGFEASIVNPVTVQVSRTSTVNITLRVGTVTQTIQVQAAAPLLDTSNATVGTVVAHQSVVEMPLNGRNYTQLMELIPGSVSTGSTYMAAGGSNYSISGTESMQNNFTLDGVYNNEEFFAQFEIQPNIDSIQEFKVQVNITSAEFGRAAGANVAVATKSGTNQLHGDVYEFLRNDAFDANSWFNNNVGLARSTYRQNQFGFTAGGPIYIPRLYNGRDKAWWFADYEGLRFSEAATNISTIPTQAMLNGDFTGEPPVYNPFTTIQTGTAPNGTPVYSRQPFANNTVPSNLISPISKAYAAIFDPVTNKPGANNWTNLSPFTLNQYQYNVRADYNFSSNLRSFYRITDQHAFQVSPTGLPVEQGLLYNTFTNAEVSLTWLINPTTVLDVKTAFNRSNIFQTNNNPPPGVAQFLSEHPIQGTPIVSLTAPLYPNLGIVGYTNPSQDGNPFVTNMWQELANVSMVRGKHSIKFGFEFEHMNAYDDGIFTSSFTFDNVPTADPQSVAATGNPVASFLLGLPSDGDRNVGNTAAYMRQNTPAAYVQDDIRVTRKLTANLGLRWEYDQWPYQKDNRLGNFDPVVHAYDWTGINPVTGQPPNAPSRSLILPEYRTFAPRVGLAYQLTPKNIIRSGFGIFYDGDYDWEGQGPRGQWPYAVAQTFSATNSILPELPLATFMPSYITPVPGTPPSENHIVARDALVPFTMQWNAGIQRQLTQSLMLEVDYVGNVGRNLPVYTNYNDPLPGPGVVGSAQHPRPEQAVAPTLGAVSLMKTLSSSNYNGLQVKVNKSFSNGMQFLASYSWSHLLDYPGGEGFSHGGTPQNPYDTRADYGNADTNYPQIFTGSWVYDLPVGRSRHFLSSASRLTDAILGQWEVSGIFHYNSGPPYSITIPFDVANTGPRTLVMRPNYVAGQTQFFGNPSPGTTGGFLNPDAFLVPSQYTFGSLGRNTGNEPYFYNLDAGIYKNFDFDSEKYRVQFRSEFFNLPNTHSFGCINTSLTTPGFGQASCTQQAARILQFALKFFW